MQSVDSLSDLQGLHAGLSGGGPPGDGDDSDEEGGPRPDPQEFYAGGQNRSVLGLSLLEGC